MIYSAVLDACVLHPMPLCDTLLCAAEAELYIPLFSQKILDETTNSLIRRERMDETKAKRYQQCITNTFPDSMIEVPESLTQIMTNAPKDRHVLATAVIAKTDIIVTYNLKDFPKESLQPYGIEAQHPDEFLLNLCEQFSVKELVKIIQEQADALKNPPKTLQQLLNKLNPQVPKLVSRINSYLESYNKSV
ncbi:MAG: PIN domain-containing protein [Microcystaceae cyanobacterium]